MAENKQRYLAKTTVLLHSRSDSVQNEREDMRDKVISGGH
jgi:hypothetical protein